MGNKWDDLSAAFSKVTSLVIVLSSRHKIRLMLPGIINSMSATCSINSCDCSLSLKHESVSKLCRNKKHMTSNGWHRSADALLLSEDPLKTKQTFPAVSKTHCSIFSSRQTIYLPIILCFINVNCQVVIECQWHMTGIEKLYRKTSCDSALCC